MSPVDLLGYLAYFLIVGFSAFQLVFMLRGRTVNLGAWPLVSLVVGLTLLQWSFVWATVPLYVVVGNCLSLLFTAANLAKVLSEPAPKEPGYVLTADGTLLEVSRVIKPYSVNQEYWQRIGLTEEELAARLGGSAAPAAPAGNADSSMQNDTRPQANPFQSITDEGIAALERKARASLSDFDHL